ncbi:hypothetical protein [Jiulongibacter sp. NS-SX5]|uniref:hypothetical protein n=1 Tax=Jiulongibacter sp. NS-SX5 TaxID=3463854 RepID=UPI004059FC24
MIDTLKDALQITLKKWPVLLLMYLLSLILAVFPVANFSSLLSELAGNSADLEGLVQGFDYTLFSDFVRGNGRLLSPAFAVMFFFGFLGSVVYAFLSGGTIAELSEKRKPFSFKFFFTQCWKVFGKYFLVLLLTGVLLFVFFLVSGLFYFIFILIAEGSSERGYVLWLLIPTILLLVLMSYGLVISFYTKVIIYRESRLGTGEAFWKAFAYVFKNPKTLGMFWLITLVGIILSGVYLLIDETIGMSSSPLIWVMVAIQQAFIITRMLLKNWNYAAAIDYFEEHPVLLFKEPLVKPESQIKEGAESETEENIEENEQPNEESETESKEEN